MSATKEIDPLGAALHAELEAAAAESAPLAWEQAPRLCRRDRGGEQTCLPYHRIWQYLALFGIARSIRSDTGFLIATLRRLAREQGARRVLISGSADYAMLAHVLTAYESERIEPEIVVTDLCHTPLMLNRWYAARKGVTIESVEANILDFRAQQPFDLVCCHSFLGWFAPQDRLRLVRNWHDLLRPGGFLVTTHRLHPTEDEAVPKQFDSEETQAQAERMRTAAEAYGGPLPASADALAQARRDYCLSYRRYPTANRESLSALLAAGGFPDSKIDDGTKPDDEALRPSGPLHGAGNRLRIIARRPG